MTISEKADEFAGQVFQKLQAAGVRASLDSSPDKIGAKIRIAQLEKVPYMVVIGQKEAEAGLVSVRHQRRGDLGVKPVDDFTSSLVEEIATRAL
jgi:threonyl-tRNA synthetase